MTTAPPKDRFGPMLESADLGAGFGVNYLGIGTPEAAPAAAGSWAGKVRAQQAASQQPSPPPMADPLSDAEAAALAEMELAYGYPDLTAEEWEKIHSPQDAAKGWPTLAEAQKTEDILIKWVKSAGRPISTENQNGVTLETWKRGNALVYSIKNADGTHFDWDIDATLGLRFHLNSQGEMIQSDKNNYQVMMQKTKDSLFIDCTLSMGMPSNPLPISGNVNNRKGLVPASLQPDGRISIGWVRGAVKDHQFIVKLPTTGAFATVDENGNAMLAQLDKLPKNITLSEQDLANHNAFAAQIAKGELSLDMFIGEDKSIEHHQAKNIVFSDSAKKQSRMNYQNLIQLEKSGHLANAPADIFRSDMPTLKKFVDAISENSRVPTVQSR